MAEMKRVIIIGGGPAGLTAAYELLKENHNKFEVIVLEETPNLGGISMTVNHNGNRMDIGGHRFFSKDDTVMDWWKDILPLQGKPSYDDKVLGRSFKIGDGPDPEIEDEVMLLRHRVSRIYYKHHFFDYPVSMSMKTIKGLGLFTTIRAGFSYLGSCIHKRKETNLENFYINRFGKVLYSMFFEGYTEKVWGRHPSEISAEWGAQRVKGLSILAVLKDIFGKIFHVKNRKVETSLIEQFWYPKYGPGQLWETVGKRIEKLGGVIRHNHRVKKIITEGDQIKSIICDTGRGDEIIDGDIFISSMPIKDLVGGMDEKIVNKEVMKAAVELPYRDFITVGLLVDKIKLKNETDIKTLGNIVPDCWIYVQDKGIKMGRIQIFNNWSPYMVKDPEKTVWIGLEYFCNEGDKMWCMDDEKFTKCAIKELVKMGIIDKNGVKDTCVKHVKKAYPAYFGSYKHIDKIASFLDGYENLFCVGRNGQHRYNNMDHSMVTAMEAVRQINKGKSNKTKVWAVNTEADYHEKK